jgi:hypothetical protein
MNLNYKQNISLGGIIMAVQQQQNKTSPANKQFWVNPPDVVAEQKLGDAFKYAIYDRVSGRTIMLLQLSPYATEKQSKSLLNRARSAARDYARDTYITCQKNYNH